MSTKWPEWSEKNPIHLKTIVEAYAVGVLHVQEWEEFNEMTGLEGTVLVFAANLKNRFHDDEVPELSLQEVAELFDEIFVASDHEKYERLKSRAIRYLRDDIRDARQFEKWFKRVYTQTMTP